MQSQNTFCSMLCAFVFVSVESEHTLFCALRVHCVKLCHTLCVCVCVCVRVCVDTTADVNGRNN